MSEPTRSVFDVAVSVKRCKNCGVEKAAAEFYRDRQNVDGLRGTCKQCWSGRGRARRMADHGLTLERERQYRNANRERIREISRESAKRHSAYGMERQRRRSSLLRATVFAWYGEDCACCGTRANLTIDHIDGRGREHREELFGSNKAAGRVFHAWLIANNFPDGYQTLCNRCNISKRRGTRCRIAHRSSRPGMAA